MALFLSSEIHQGVDLFSVQSGGKQCAFMSLSALVTAQNIPLINEPIAECAKHHGSLVTQQNFSTWRLYFSNEGRC